MKTFIQKVKFLPIVAGILSSSIPMLNVALAVAVSLTMAINNTSATSYTNAPFIDDTHNEMLIAGGQLLPSGLDSRVLDSNGNSLPRMLADNNTLFTANSTAHTSSTFTFTTGNTPSSTMPIITGVSGNVSTIDDPDLELDRHFDISISGYYNTSVNGTSQSVLYKQGAAKINVSAPSTITFHALNADDSDNWTMAAAGVATGNHTVRVYADGFAAHLYVDGAEVTSHSLYISSVATVNSDATGQGSEDGFYYNGRYWVFFEMSNNLFYSTSLDSTAWGAKIAVTSANLSSAAKTCVYFDGTYVYYIDGYSNEPVTSHKRLAFRRGVPEASGNITWSAAEQVVDLNSSDASFNSTDLTVTSGGYPAITYDQQPSFHQSHIIMASTNDGTWTTAGGYPITIGSAMTFAGWSRIAAFSAADKAYQIRPGYTGSGSGQIIGRYYNGISWSGTDEEITNFNINLFGDIMATSDEVFLTYQYGTTIYLKHRSPSGSWDAGNGTAIATTTAGSCASTITYDAVNGLLIIFYAKTETSSVVYAKIYAIASGALSSEITVASPTLSNVGNSYRLVYTGKSGVQGVNHGGSWEIKNVPLEFPWEWNDTPNNWWWATSNTMSYTDNITLAVQGVQELLYAPNNTIYGNALPDRSAVGTHTGTIYWGTSTLTVTGAALLTLPATNITTSSATLNGQLLDMVGMASYTAYFDYGLTSSYGNTASFGVMSAPGLLSANVSGLTPHATYHFRAVAVSSNITLYGGDLTFTTLAGPGGGNFQFGGGNARVFKNYLSANDTLVTAEIVNTYLPYYPNQSPKEYFTVQLISTDNTTILAATPQQDWGDKPIGIYLNPTQSATITDGAGYYVRVQGNFASNVTVQYQLQNVPWANDWKGADLTKLDDWCIYVALDMQTFYSGSGYVTVLTDRKLAITDAVGGYFTAGIAGIGQVRPNLFTTSQQHPSFSAGISSLPADNTTAYTAYVGSAIVTDAGVLATPLGMTARDALAGIILLVMFGVIATGTSAMGGFGALGLFLISIPLLWLGTYFKIIGVQWVMILVIIFGFFAVRQFFIKTT